MDKKITEALEKIENELRIYSFRASKPRTVEACAKDARNALAALDIIREALEEKTSIPDLKEKKWLVLEAGKDNRYTCWDCGSISLIRVKRIGIGTPTSVGIEIEHMPVQQDEDDPAMFLAPEERAILRGRIEALAEEASEQRRELAAEDQRTSDQNPIQDETGYAEHDYIEIVNDADDRHR